MAETFKVRMKKGNIVEVPSTNLSQFKRVFFGQIDYIDEPDSEPIISKPVIKEIKPTVDKFPVDDEQPESETTKEITSMTKKELQDLAKNIEGYKASMSKQDLINLINK